MKGKTIEPITIEGEGNCRKGPFKMVCIAEEAPGRIVLYAPAKAPSCVWIFNISFCDEIEGRLAVVAAHRELGHALC